jgi:hypothetical protein
MKLSEAIANIEYARHQIGCESDFSEDALDMAISALEKQEQERWIPVTERLPEVGQSVMISVAGVYTAEGCLKEDGNWCQFRWSAEHDRAVIGAWRPLPEPYTEEEA